MPRGKKKDSKGQKKNKNGIGENKSIGGKIE